MRTGEAVSAAQRAEGLPSDAKPYPGDRRYYVTPRGEVFSTLRELRRLKPWRCTGYPVVSLVGRKKRLVHRMVLETFVGACPEGMQGALFDGDRSNPELSNLRWASRSENERDKRRHGRDNRGERHGMAKLTPGKVRAIRRSAGRVTDVARRFGISAPTVCDIRSGRSWAHLPSNAQPNLMRREAS